MRSERARRGFSPDECRTAERVLEWRLEEQEEELTHWCVSALSTVSFHSPAASRKSNLPELQASGCVRRESGVDGGVGSQEAGGLGVRMQGDSGDRAGCT